MGVEGAKNLSSSISKLSNLTVLEIDFWESKPSDTEIDYIFVGISELINLISLNMSLDLF